MPPPMSAAFWKELESITGSYESTGHAQSSNGIVLSDVSFDTRKIAQGTV